jgi:O-methyltransferase
MFLGRFSPRLPQDMTADTPIPAPKREFSAAPPGPDAERLRAAYLSLLKLCLCDLAGGTTVSVGRTDDGLAFARQLFGEQLQLRTNGMDWPLTGLTMVGLARLDDLHRCVETIVADDIEGDLIEAGTWRGGATILMRATLDALGAEGRTVWAADSFQGFPERDDEGDAVPSDRGDDLGAFDFLSVPLEEVKESFSRLGCSEGVRFVPGFFENTLPPLREGRWSLVRLDGDTYEATRLTLDCLYPGLSVGGYLIVDDYGALEECRRAVDDFRRERGLVEPIEEIDWTCVRWRRAEPEPADRPNQPAPASTRTGPPRPSASAVVRGNEGVPNLRELVLEREIAALRDRLAAAESAGTAGISRLTARVRRRRGRRA